MPSRHRPHVWKISLLIAGTVCLVLASPCALLGVLGLLGIVADVGPAENRDAGLQFLAFAAAPAVLGLVLLIAGLAVRIPNRRCSVCGKNLRGAVDRCRACSAAASGT